MSALYQPSRLVMSGLKRLSRERGLTALCVLLVSILGIFAAFRFHSSLAASRFYHVSFEGTEDFYRAFNRSFASEHPGALELEMSHAGSIRQARALALGMKADMASLASEYDLRESGLAGDAIDETQTIALPFYSTIAFVVREGNPKTVMDWSDLFRPDVAIALPDPHMSGAGRWAFAALHIASLEANAHNEKTARLALQDLMFRSEIIDSGSRIALSRFRNRSSADVFLTWESDALRLSEFEYRDLSSVSPRRSPLARPYIKRLERRLTTEKAAEDFSSYLSYHYDGKSMELASRFAFRTDRPKAISNPTLPSSELYEIAEIDPDQPRFWEYLFGQGGLYDSLAQLRRAHLSLE